jgi:hypothetical protein
MRRCMPRERLQVPDHLWSCSLKTNTDLQIHLCHLRDVHAGTLLATYKSNASSPGALSPLGRDHLLAAQLGKGAIHAWTWNKVSCFYFYLMLPLFLFQRDE